MKRFFYAMLPVSAPMLWFLLLLITEQLTTLNELIIKNISYFLFLYNGLIILYFIIKKDKRKIIASVIGCFVLFVIYWSAISFQPG